MNALIDHKSRVSYRTVNKVVVFGVDDGHDLELFGLSRNFIIVLLERRG